MGMRKKQKEIEKNEIDSEVMKEGEREGDRDDVNEIIPNKL